MKGPNDWIPWDALGESVLKPLDPLTAALEAVSPEEVALLMVAIDREERRS